jgi:osmotically-inducible protein OsmY
MQRSDTEIHKDIVAELHWDPSLRDDDVAVAVRDGVVTFAGFADSYADKWKAERIASKIRGVKAIANDIEVKLPAGSERTDPDIARAATNALQWNVSVPRDRIQVKVEKGWVTLEGDVDYYYQAEAAERAIRFLTGVKGVTNLIKVKQRVSAADLKERIKESLQRSAQLDAERITVEVQGSKAILRGTVRSYAEMKEAERAVLNAPGITEVQNRLTVDLSVYATV